VVTVTQTAEPDDWSRFISDGAGQPKVSDTTGDAALLRFVPQPVGVGTDLGCAHPVARRGKHVEAVRRTGRHDRTDLGQFALDLIDGLIASRQEAKSPGAGHRGGKSGR
jgi:hypothetical protein